MKLIIRIIGYLVVFVLGFFLAAGVYLYNLESAGKVDVISGERYYDETSSYVTRAFEREAEQMAKYSYGVLREAREQYDRNPNYKDWYLRIKRINASCESTHEFIQGVKFDLIIEGEGYTQWGHIYNGYETKAVRLMMLDSSKARAIHDSLISCKELLLNGIAAGFGTILDTVLIVSKQIPDPRGRLIDWENFYFQGLTINQAVATLSKMQYDLRKAQQIILLHDMTLSQNRRLEIETFTD